MSLSLRYIDNVHPDLKGEMRHVGRWLRREYEFSLPIEIRLVNRRFLTDTDDEECALRWWQNEKSFRSEIAVFSFYENLAKEGPNVAYPTVFAAVGRALYYYYRAINDLSASEVKAIRWGDKVLEAYIEGETPPVPCERHLTRPGSALPAIARRAYSAPAAVGVR